MANEPVATARDSDEATFSDEEGMDVVTDPSSAALASIDPRSRRASHDAKRKSSIDSPRSDSGKIMRPSFKPLEEALVTDSANELILHPDFR